LPHTLPKLIVQLGEFFRCKNPSKVPWWPVTATHHTPIKRMSFSDGINTYLFFCTEISLDRPLKLATQCHCFPLLEFFHRPQGKQKRVGKKNFRPLLCPNILLHEWGQAAGMSVPSFCTFASNKSTGIFFCVICY
jgi:hypothetical protein